MFAWVWVYVYAHTHLFIHPCTELSIYLPLASDSRSKDQRDSQLYANEKQEPQPPFEWLFPRRWQICHTFWHFYKSSDLLPEGVPRRSLWVVRLCVFVAVSAPPFSFLLLLCVFLLIDVTSRNILWVGSYLRGWVFDGGFFWAVWLFLFISSFGILMCVAFLLRRVIHTSFVWNASGDGCYLFTSLLYTFYCFHDFSFFLVFYYYS